MTNYYAVKLTKFEKDGKINPRARTYGLVYCSIGPHDEILRAQELTPSIIFTHSNPNHLGAFYGDLIKNNEGDPTAVPLSFKSPFDIIPQKNGKGIYRSEDFPTELQATFIRGALEDLVQ
jgi:hypothetical protein